MSTVRNELKSHIQLIIDEASETSPDPNLKDSLKTISNDMFYSFVPISPQG
jgi:hypothetical protein